MGVVICNNCKSFWHSSEKSCQECNSQILTETADSNSERIAWVLTDPDNFQFGRKIDDSKFEFKEYDWHSAFAQDVTLEQAQEQAFNWTELTIDLDKFSDAEKESISGSYYGSVDELKEQCGESWEWILAECIFEVESGLY